MIDTKHLTKPSMQAFIKYSFTILFLFLLKTSFACQCPLTQLSKSECKKYELIFRGKVISVAPCDNKPGVALFEVQDLYKGNLPKQFQILFNCDEPCASKFNVGEEWIIYTRFKQINNGLIDWCSRSRRFIKNEKEDFYAVTYGNTYDQEIKFLQDSLGLHRLMKAQTNNLQHRNLLPTPTETIIILLSSILVIFLFYFLFNKFFK